MVIIEPSSGFPTGSLCQLRRHGESERFAARVLHLSHDADLALLTVDEPGFFDSLTPLSLGGLPELREEVLGLGVPVGDILAKAAD